MAKASPPPSRFHNDEPTLFDQLGHAQQVERVAALIQGCEPPFVVGIHGDWGSGKTSFLKMLHLHLTGRDVDGSKQADARDKLWPGVKPDPERYEAVWFEAWRHQHDGNPIVALLQEIRTHFNWRQKTFDKIDEMGFAAAMSLEELTKHVGFQPSKIVEARDAWAARTSDQPLPSQLHRRLLEQAIGTLLGKGEKRLVVFIDDLDRCQGEMTFRLLEALKIYLSLRNCVFVLALDVRGVQRAVAAELVKAGMALAPKEGSGEGQWLAEHYAADYLSKLFQVVEHLPYLSEPRSYLQALLEQAAVPDFGTWLELICKADLLPPNPRKIKAFVNALGLAVARLPATATDGSAPNCRMVLIATYLRLFANEVYRILESDADFWKELHGFVTRTDQGTEHGALRKLRLSDRAEPLGPDGAGYSYQKLFPDPAQEGLFRVAKLIREQRVVLSNPDCALYFRQGG